MVIVLVQSPPLLLRMGWALSFHPLKSPTTQTSFALGSSIRNSTFRASAAPIVLVTLAFIFTSSCSRLMHCKLLSRLFTQSSNSYFGGRYALQLSLRPQLVAIAANWRLDITISDMMSCDSPLPYFERHIFQGIKYVKNCGSLCFALLIESIQFGVKV